MTYFVRWQSLPAQNPITRYATRFTMHNQTALRSSLIWLLFPVVICLGARELSRLMHKPASTQSPSENSECSFKNPQKTIPLQALRNGQLVYSPPLPFFFFKVPDRPIQGATSGTIPPADYYPDLEQFFPIGTAARYSTPPINALYCNQIGICHLIHERYREARLAFAKAIIIEQKLRLGLDGSEQDNDWINRPLPQPDLISQKQENQEGDFFAQLENKAMSPSAHRRRGSGSQLVDELNSYGASHNLTQLSENYTANALTKDQSEQCLTAAEVEPSCRLSGYLHNYKVAVGLENQ